MASQAERTVDNLREHARLQPERLGILDDERLSAEIPVAEASDEHLLQHMHAAQEQLGPAPGHAPLRRLPGDVRHHLHVRWCPRRCAGARVAPARHADPGLYAAGELVGGLFSYNYPVAAA
ncbi:MAG: hypothetical protein R2853_18665 [Thermomicrobiales bacterium]